MKLDRNLNPDGRGKYALINLRKTDKSLPEIRELVSKAIGGQCLQFGDNPDTEFFVIKLKDKYAASALMAYASAVYRDGDLEYANEILALAGTANCHPNKKKPD